MGDFGAYDKVKQLDPAGHVFTARKPPATEEQYVIKLLKGPRATALRLAADLQKGMTAANAPAWAPIIEIGKLPTGGSYYVTRFFPSSAERVFERKAPITSAQLLRLSDQIARGARMET
jgi:hypothetical protein